MKTKSRFKRTVSVWLAAAMLISLFAGINITAFASGDTYETLVNENFENNPTLPYNVTAVRSNHDFAALPGYGNMLDINVNTIKKSDGTYVNPGTGNAKYYIDFQNDLTGKNDTYAQIDFDLGIYDITDLTQVRFWLNNGSTNYGQAVWNVTTGGFQFASQKIVGEAFKPEVGKVNHFTFKIQLTDESGATVNKLTYVRFNDVEQNTNISCNSGTMTRFMLTTDIRSSKTWSNAQFGLNFDNLVITRYSGSDSTVPDRRTLLNKINSVNAQLSTAYSEKVISKSEYSVYAARLGEQAGVYSTSNASAAFATAANALTALENEIKAKYPTDYQSLLIDSFEGNKILGTLNTSDDIKLVNSENFAASYGNTEFGFDQMLEMSDENKTTGNKNAISLARSFDAVPAGTANAYMEFEFDMGILQKGLSQFNFILTSNNAQIGYLRWNSQSGMLQVYNSSNADTTVCSTAVKSSSATSANKLDHIKFVIQVTDEDGTVVNKFKSFKINDVSQSKEISLGSTASIDGVKIVMNSPGAGWHGNTAAQNAQTHIDNLAVMRYVSADGTSPAPDRYSFYKRASETFAKITAALENGSITETEAVQFRTETKSAAEVYKNGKYTATFDAAIETLADIEIRLNGGFETLYYNNFETEGTECESYGSLVGFNKMKIIERAAGASDPSEQVFSFTNSTKSNDTVQVDVDLGVYNIEGLANTYINLKDESGTLGYFNWNPGSGAFSFTAQGTTKSIVGESYKATEIKPDHFTIKFTKKVENGDTSYSLNQVSLNDQTNNVTGAPEISGEITRVTVSTKRKSSVDAAYGVALDNVLVTSYAPDDSGKSPVPDYYGYRNSVAEYDGIMNKLGVSDNAALAAAKELCFKVTSVKKAEAALETLKTETGKALADSFEWSDVSSVGQYMLSDDITLPSNYTVADKTFDLVWSSDAPSVITATGDISRGKLNRSAVLTATATVDNTDLKFEKSFDVRVLANGTAASGSVSGQILAAARVSLAASGNINVVVDGTETASAALEIGVSDVQLFVDTVKDKYILYVNGTEKANGVFAADRVTSVAFEGGMVNEQVLMKLDESAYEVLGLKFKDASGNTRTVPTAGGKLSGVILADRNIYDAPAVVVAALYDNDGKLMSAKYCEAPLAALDETVGAELELSLPEDETVLATTKIRVFVFNALNDIKPISKMFEYIVGDNLLQNVAIHIAGDSTAERYGEDYYPRAGWGQVISENFMTAQL